MSRFLLSLAALLTVGISPGWSQDRNVARSIAEGKGTYLGVLFSPVPDILYDQLPHLPRGRGVVICHVLPDSPAARAHLCRNDILLTYDGESIRDGEHAARLIRDDRPERKVGLTFLRGGKEMTAEATLALGPALKIAQAVRLTGEDAIPRGLLKPINLAAVSITATPLGGNSMKVTIEFYQDSTARLQSITCTGPPAKIDEQILKLPARVQEQAKLGLQRLRAQAIQKDKSADASPSVRPDR
jgi:hypothetical protein